MNVEQYRLLEKFLKGKCTEREKATVKALLDTDEGRTMFTHIMKKLDEEAGQGLPDEHALVQTRLDHMEKEIYRRIQAGHKPMSLKRGWRRLVATAAIWIAALCTIGYVSYRYVSRGESKRALSYVTKSNESGKPLLYVLPDGSQIYLGAHSEIVYPENFVGSERKVSLTGEAFFDVEHDPSAPFVVVAQQVVTRVLGTSFRVTGYDGDDTEISVASGKVSVHAASAEEDEPLAILTAGKRLVYNHSAKHFELGEVPAVGLEAWKAGDFIFQEEPLLSIARHLSRRFDVTINVLDNELAGYRLSATFPAEEELEQILGLLSSTGKFKYRREGETNYVLYK